MKTKKKAPIIRIKGFNDDWEQRKFSDIAQRESLFQTSSYACPSVEYEDVIAEEGRLNKDIRLKEVQKTGIKFDGTQVLYGKLRPYLHNWLNPDFMGIAVGDWWVLRPVKIDKNFLYRLIQTKKFDDVANQSSGSKMPRADWNLVSQSEFIVPTSLEEQCRIAEVFEGLDHLITLHQREIDRIVCLRKAMVEKMFPQNGADVPAVRFGRYKEPWRLCQFSEIFMERHIIDTISDEYPQLAFTIEEGVIRPEDKKTNKRDFLIIDKATKKYLQTEYDDIIYNPANVIYGAIHRNALGKGCVSPIYKIFYTNQDSTFMECIVRHPNFIKEISRSMEGTVKKLRTLKPKAFLEMSAYIAPTIEEQRQIGEYFHQMDRLIEIEKEELEKIKHIKSACLEKMFV